MTNELKISVFSLGRKKSIYPAFQLFDISVKNNLIIFPVSRNIFYKLMVLIIQLNNITIFNSLNK